LRRVDVRTTRHQTLHNPSQLTATGLTESCH
jgi:hypothetical protein